MIKVKEYLDKNLFCTWSIDSKLKKNRHYDVSGTWIYPKNWEPRDFNSWNKLSEEEKKLIPDHISVNINNETIIVGNICVNNEWSIYHYLQTYEHLPRGDADENGYYHRSTDDEIIKYIDGYLQKIKDNENHQK